MRLPEFGARWIAGRSTWQKLSLEKVRVRGETPLGY
jgi:hypothetical protein